MSWSKSDLESWSGRRWSSIWEVSRSYSLVTEICRKQGIWSYLWLIKPRELVPWDAFLFWVSLLRTGDVSRKVVLASLHWQTSPNRYRHILEMKTRAWNGWRGPEILGGLAKLTWACWGNGRSHCWTSTLGDDGVQEPLLSSYLLDCSCHLRPKI